MKIVMPFFLEWNVLMRKPMAFLLFFAYGCSALATSGLEDIQPSPSPAKEVVGGPSSVTVPLSPPAPQSPVNTSVDQRFEYRIGVNDLLKIEVFQAKDLDNETRVNSNGLISVPLVGPVKVVGLSVQEAERLIESELSKSYLQAPHVTVFVKEYESQKFTVEGQVKKGGVFPLMGKMSLVQAVATAGGLDTLANESSITLFRKQENGQITSTEYNFSKIREGKLADPPVISGDIIVVPKHGGKAAFETVKGLVPFSVFFP